ncbi:MAG TPA: hypothetical protein VF476_05060 [Chitinophagaceae bacterium]
MNKEIRWHPSSVPLFICSSELPPSSAGQDSERSLPHSLARQDPERSMPPTYPK